MNLVEILKDCPKGTKLYSPMLGESYLKHVNTVVIDRPIVITNKNDDYVITLTYDGRYYDSGECMLFPSKDNRDWFTFNVPKKEFKFKPFDKVLVRDCDGDTWSCDIFSHISDNKNSTYATTSHTLWRQCIPYRGNEHLVGTTNNPK